MDPTDRPTAAAPPQGDLAGTDALRQAVRFAASDRLPSLVDAHASAFGAVRATIYLADLQQRVLLPFAGSAGPASLDVLSPLPVDGTLAGEAYQHLQPRSEPLPDGLTRVWLPMLDNPERLGVLALDHPGEPGTDQLVRLRRLSDLVGELVTTKTPYGDTIVRARRSARMGLAAEIQWSLLPPLTFASPDVVVSAALEPAYTMAGDSLDYAVDEGVARLALFDGMGHGLLSAQLSALAVAAYRQARREGQPLVRTVGAVHEAVLQAYPGEPFATAVLAELDTGTGVFSWVDAGHPEPLLLRAGSSTTLTGRPALPLGLDAGADPADGDGTRFPVHHVQLQEGDVVVLYSDGIPEARSPQEEVYGMDPLVRGLLAHLAEGLPAPEVLRRGIRDLLAFQQGHLRDDATLLMLRWRGGHEVFTDRA